MMLVDDSYVQRDPLWNDIQRLRKDDSDDLTRRIFNAYRGVGALTRAADVLRGLAMLTVYPAASTRPRSVAVIAAACEEDATDRNAHPGPATNFRVVRLPARLRTARGRLAQASDAFCALVDQILLGAAWRDGTSFPALGDVDEIPWTALAEVARLPHALDVLYDWGTIVRMALAGASQQTPPLLLLPQRYERATLRWLVQRLGFDEHQLLCVASSSSSSTAAVPKSLSLPSTTTTADLDEVTCVECATS